MGLGSAIRETVMGIGSWCLECIGPSKHFLELS